MSTQVEDGLFKAHQDTKSGLLADVNIPKRVISIASDAKRLLLRLEDGTWVEFPSVAHGAIHAAGGEGEIEGSALKGLRVTEIPSFAGQNLTGQSGAVKRLNLCTGGVARWTIQSDSSAESGSDSGSALDVVARHDDGSTIDLILSVARAAGGVIAFGGSTNRPLRIASPIQNGLKFRADTALVGEADDGNDQVAINLCGGGAASASRGGFVSVRGNERSSSGGTVTVTAGDGVEGAVKIMTGAASDERIVFLKDGKIKLPGHSGSGVRLLAVDPSGFITSGSNGSAAILDSSVTSTAANGPLLQFGAFVFPANFWVAGKMFDAHGFVKASGGGLILPFFKGDGAEESLEAFNDAGVWEFRLIVRCISVSNGIATFVTSYWINGTGNTRPITSSVTVSTASSFYFRANAYTVGVVASLVNFYAKIIN